MGQQTSQPTIPNVRQEIKFITEEELLQTNSKYSKYSKILDIKINTIKLLVSVFNGSSSILLQIHDMLFLEYKCLYFDKSENFAENFEDYSNGYLLAMEMTKVQRNNLSEHLLKEMDDDPLINEIEKLERFKNHILMTKSEDYLTKNNDDFANTVIKYKKIKNERDEKKVVIENLLIEIIVNIRLFRETEYGHYKFLQFLIKIIKQMNYTCEIVIELTDEDFESKIIGFKL
jgi:hypothetical protein